MTDNNLNILQQQYPSQEDPDYWKKVPRLFELEFADKLKLPAFKSNWIVHSVPLYLPTLDAVTEGYIKENIRIITENPDLTTHRPKLDLMTEPHRGHTIESYGQMTRSLDVMLKHSGDNIHYPLFNVGYIRSFRVHNVLMFEQTTGKQIKDYDVVVEVGGGYGEFAKIIREVGFTGQYYDIDFAPMCMINQFYNDYNPNNNYVNHVSELPSFGKKKVLFIGTWSFSELPIEYRQEIVKKMPAQCNWLLACQAAFPGIDNDTYFDEMFEPRLTKQINKIDIPWHPFQNGNYYYFAT